MTGQPTYIGKADVAEMLDLTTADFTRGLIVLARLDFPEANQTSPGDPRWLREAIENWRTAHWDKPVGYRPAHHDAKTGRAPRSPEQSAMLNMARTP